MTTTFYAPPACFRGESVELPPEEAHHAIKVLRHRVGDPLVVVDGEGGWYESTITHLDRRRVVAAITHETREVGEPSYALTIGMALLKNQNRYDWFLEKAVEMGVTCIMPLVSARTQKQRLNAERTQKRLIAAMKQAGRSRLPICTAPRSFSQALTETDNSYRLLCHEAAQPEQHITRLLSSKPRPDQLTVLIGPEGGFSDEEVAEAQGVGFRIASLGPRRLRAETAAIVAASAVMLHIE